MRHNQSLGRHHLVLRIFPPTSGGDGQAISTCCQLDSGLSRDQKGPTSGLSCVQKGLTSGFSRVQKALTSGLTRGQKVLTSDLSRGG